MSSAADPILTALVHELCVRNPDLSPSEVDPEAELLGAGYLDSLSATEFLSHVEAAYDVAVGIDRLVGDLATIRALATYITDARGRPC